MRRAVVAVVGTVLGTTLMVAAKLGTRPMDSNVLLGGTDGTGGVLPGETDPSASPLPPGATPPPTPAPGATPAPGTTGPTARPPASSPPPGGGGGGGTGLKTGTFAGPGVTQKYGTIKVTIVVSGGRITSATATYPTGGDTGDINARAIPRLNQETLAAQSANIATVSGATYTSGAYKTSLQAAINAAKA